MNKISVLGIDLAKNIFHLHGINDHGEVVLQKKVKRTQLLPLLARLSPCLIGIEAGGAMHYWARKFTELGHTVRAMAPQFVNPYIKSNKNDVRDAQGICEAVQRPGMRFVPIKSIDQQTILHLHHSRRLLLSQRIALSNHLRGVLAEYGLIIPRGNHCIRRYIPQLLEDGSNELNAPMRTLIMDLYDQYQRYHKQIDGLEQSIRSWHQQCRASQRLMRIPGIGLLTATALVGLIGDGRAFKNGRQLSAYLGLVPRQASSGGKTRLLGISKRGDGYVRMLLVHGARSVINSHRRRQRAGLPSQSLWLTQLLTRTHVNKACVAQANKTARMAWCVLSTGQAYQPQV